MRNKKPAGLQAYFQKAINKRGTSSLTLKTLSSHNHTKAKEVASNNMICEVTCCWQDALRRAYHFWGAAAQTSYHKSVRRKQTAHRHRGTLWKQPMVTLSRDVLIMEDKEETWHTGELLWHDKVNGNVMQKQEKKRTFLEKQKQTKNCGVQKRPSNWLYHAKTNFEILSTGPMAVKYVNIFMGEGIKNSLEYYYKFSLSLILLTDTYNIYK